MRRSRSLRPRDHRVGLVGILVHHLGDGVQRVEEEVRLQLHAEQLQPGLGQLRLEVLALAAAPVILDAVRRGDDGDVDGEVAAPAC